MNIKKTLVKLLEVAKSNGLSVPYLVGGVPRDLFLAHIEKNNKLKADVFKKSDFDITTGNMDAHTLAELFAAAVGAKYKRIDDHHAKVIIDHTVFDFSKNFVYPNIDQILKKMGKKLITDLEREVYSRDFTVNTIMLTGNFSKMIDLTGRGKADLKAKVLDCPVDCDIALQADPKRMLRAYYFRAKYGFSFSKSLEKSLMKNIDLLPTINVRYASELINDILILDPNLLDVLIHNGFLQRLPITKYVNNLLVKGKRVLDVLK